MKNSWFNQGLGSLGAWRQTAKRFAMLLLTLLLPAVQAAAQTATAETPEMADALRGSGKIYVVVAVVTVVLAGLLAFLISLDRKVSRLERELKE